MMILYYIMYYNHCFFACLFVFLIREMIAAVANIYVNLDDHNFILITPFEY